MRKLEVAEDDAGQRLDRFVRRVLPDEPLSRVFKLIRTGGVKVDGRKSREGHRLTAGQVVEIRGAGDAPAAAPRPKSAREPHGLTILYRDDDVLAIDKPPFLLVQKGDEGEEPSLDEIAARAFGRGDSHTFVPSLAHRLDRGTSGVVLLGLSARGLRGLTQAFRGREVAKTYVALVAGRPAEDAFTVDLPLRRGEASDRRGALVAVSHGPGAVPARTDVVVLARAPERGLALVHAKPFTGRTHQIRVHLRAAKLPIVGDPVYGVPASNREWKRATGLARQFLHAARVEFGHPADPTRRVAVESPLPPDLVRALEHAGLAVPPGPRT